MRVAGKRTVPSCPNGIRAERVEEDLAESAVSVMSKAKTTVWRDRVTAMTDLTKHLDGKRGAAGDYSELANALRGKFSSSIENVTA